ncbi:hypothetical protein [Allomesorhizobium camelthorni]|uniref:Holin n=1 Tax=Allomesorhizobium camelthorni TaxID=475069 RepID=A0A6G4WFV0_9HYPH|nr:hypothetical protein [Mesorhizobium camelthorni]NGO53631.1 hypothetical protein [Mesorhizobium camelthorni]
MTASKPWYLSRTIWASLVTILTAAMGLMGMSGVGIDDAALTDAVLQAVTALAGVIALFGRLSATDRIG